jgi:hypothetical protein
MAPGEPPALVHHQAGRVGDMLPAFRQAPIAARYRAGQSVNPRALGYLAAA